MARIYAMLAGNGTIDGIRILSGTAVERASRLVWPHDCVMTKRRLRMGFGFMHNETGTAPMGANMAAFGHIGAGGKARVGLIQARLMLDGLYHRYVRI